MEYIPAWGSRALHLWQLKRGMDCPAVKLEVTLSLESHPFIHLSTYVHNVLNELLEKQSSSLDDSIDIQKFHLERKKYSFPLLCTAKGGNCKYLEKNSSKIFMIFSLE